MSVSIKDVVYGVHMNAVTHGKVSELLLEEGIDLRNLRPGEMILICNNSWEWGGLCDSRTPARFRIVHNDGGVCYLKLPILDVLDRTSSMLKVSIFIHDNVACPVQIKEQLGNSLSKQRLAQQTRRNKS